MPMVARSFNTRTPSYEWVIVKPLATLLVTRRLQRIVVGDEISVGRERHLRPMAFAANPQGQRVSVPTSLAPLASADRRTASPFRFASAMNATGPSADRQVPEALVG